MITVYPLLLKHRIDKTGRSAIAIRIVRGRKTVATKSLGYKIPPSNWDEEKKRVKSSQPNHSMLNTLIKNKMQEYEGEFMKAELLGVSVSNTKIRKVVKGENAHRDYFSFCEEVIAVKYPKDSQKETRRQHLNELSKLKQFRDQVTFADIDHKFLQEYKQWMIQVRGNTDNTVWKTFKAMYAMTNEALKRGGYITESPFKEFDRGRYKQGRRAFLEFGDCLKIEEVLQKDIDERLKLVGYYFLFMCYGSLRFRDATTHFNYDKHVVNDTRIVITTTKFGENVDILIHSRLKAVLDFIKDKPFKEANYTFNRDLKILQRIAGVSVNLTAHVGRHTFGAMMAKLEVPVKLTQLALGHRDAKSTEIYYHIVNTALDKEMRKFDDLK